MTGRSLPLALPLSLALVALMGAPLFAQIDLSGDWATREHQDSQDRGPGPEMADYTGLPINAEARSKALYYDASQLSLPERQCLYYTAAYIMQGPHSITLWSDNDPDISGKIIAWRVSGANDRPMFTVWMDGRPHPASYAPHTASGFTTGEWHGDLLETYTTHLKAGQIRRNGVPSSDQATITAFYIRHGDLLTINQLVDDPVYLTEPYMMSRTWQLDPHAGTPRISAPCTPEAEVARLDGDSGIPHFPLGGNPFLNEMTKFYNIPQDVAMGGAEEMYPEFRKKLKDRYVRPEQCTRYCCAANLGCITDGSGRPGGQ